MTRRLILLRHGQTEYNATRRMQGHLDTQLSDLGLEQAKTAARYLATQNITKIVSSDLRRAQDTAMIIAEKLGLDISFDSRLRETHLGEWQAKTHEEVDTAYPGARAFWRENPTWAPPGGESRIDVAQRSSQVVDEFMRHYANWDDATVLFVSHGGTISALTARLLNLETHHYSVFSGLGNTAWAQLIARPRSLQALTYPGERKQTESYLESDFLIDDEVRWYLEGWNQTASIDRES
ncbi:phosphoglycerate mutase [Corynebacterium kutscheri]|uniref:Fructose-2,6-bisphosphatase n=1 Tax=Corynebacterium kutscheri TaxID=35755 RepID=A0A0F6TDI0_9CORY|nr:histidine phosphatase family protein [Corynebacterium kutscheri]AKE40911.1 fructose-2,6-bisphosphatase [Corynebacterium kutscheri]VEH06709.1 phosphoglycerate mutase [Corynebacterium kutscheri]VEH09210.1 phosphoglycerate mutase [Corynebacterium kutscheri]VEH79296.1 phosphoglycerate mutase [Corynebacterium kutscheri]